MTPQTPVNGPLSDEQGEQVPVDPPAVTDAPMGSDVQHRWEALFQRQADDLAARLAEAEATLGRVRESLDALEASVQSDGLGVRLVRPSVLMAVNQIRRALDGTR